MKQWRFVEGEIRTIHRDGGQAVSDFERLITNFGLPVTIIFLIILGLVVLSRWAAGAIILPIRDKLITRVTAFFDKLDGSVDKMVAHDSDMARGMTRQEDWLTQIWERLQDVEAKCDEILRQSTGNQPAPGATRPTWGKRRGSQKTSYYPAQAPGPNYAPFILQASLIGIWLVMLILQLLLFFGIRGTLDRIEKGRDGESLHTERMEAARKREVLNQAILLQEQEKAIRIIKEFNHRRGD
jgi:hypothetical protein